MIRMSALFQALFRTSAIIGPFLAGDRDLHGRVGRGVLGRRGQLWGGFCRSVVAPPAPTGSRQVTALGLKSVKEGLHFLRPTGRCRAYT